MASFEGTVQEFHHFIGPRIRNAVNALTRKERNRLNGVCEFCGKKATLESAHLHKRGRRDLTEGVLEQYLDGGVVRIPDLATVEQRILEAHRPLSETFKFLCKPCHTEYDSVKPSSHQAPQSIKDEEHGEFKKLPRVKGWGKKDTQKNHKIIQAFRMLERMNGTVFFSDLEHECTSKSSKYYVGSKSIFAGHLSSMKTDKANSHGKVFYLEEGERKVVKIYGVVRSIIEAHFPAP